MHVFFCQGGHNDICTILAVKKADFTANGNHVGDPPNNDLKKKKKKKKKILQQNEIGITQRMREISTTYEGDLNRFVTVRK